MPKILIGNFKGAKGDKGDKGEKGEQGPIGPQGPQGFGGFEIGQVVLCVKQYPGWLACEGQELNRSAYPELFEMIGTQYGSYTDTTFRLPVINPPIDYSYGTLSLEFKKPVNGVKYYIKATEVE